LITSKSLNKMNSFISTPSSSQADDTKYLRSINNSEDDLLPKNFTI